MTSFYDCIALSDATNNFDHDTTKVVRTTHQLNATFVHAELCYPFILVQEMSWKHLHKCLKGASAFKREFSQRQVSTWLTSGRTPNSESQMSANGCFDFKSCYPVYSANVILQRFDKFQIPNILDKDVHDTRESLENKNTRQHRG